MVNKPMKRAHHSDNPLPFVAPHRVVPFTAPFGWLADGWRDFLQAKQVSLVYGWGVFVLSVLVAVMAYLLGGIVLLITALSGFVIVAPLLAFGLYSVSRQLCEGKEPSLKQSLRAMRRPVGNALVFALVLLVVFMIWARAGMMVHVFFPLDGQPDREDIMTFLAIGSAVGAVFAAIAFATVATSLPMLANRDVDVVTAVVSSINAVLRNKPAMALWGVLIVILTLIGFATAFFGLVVIIPWLAYATWHSYRDLLDVSQWPILAGPDGEETGQK
jgi:uncharacterized membrane protein